MSDVTWIISLTVIGVLVLQSIVGLFIAMLFMANAKSWPHRMTLRVITGSKPVVATNVKWRYHNSKQYGAFIIAKLKNKKIIMPKFDSKWMLPQFGGRLYFDATVSDEAYYVNVFKQKEKEKVSGEDLIKEIEAKYKVNEFVSEDIINPVLHADRNGIIDMVHIMNNLEKESVPWYKNPHLTSIGIFMFTVILCIVMLVITTQFAGDIIASARPVVQEQATNIATNIAETVSQPR
jgi:ABC-type sugar transport system permease subunit